MVEHGAHQSAANLRCKMDFTSSLSKAEFMQQYALARASRLDSLKNGLDIEGLAKDAEDLYYAIKAKCD
jgi:hypothetical protein